MYTTEITKVNEIAQTRGSSLGSSQFLNWKCRRMMWTKKMDGRTRWGRCQERWEDLRKEKGFHQNCQMLQKTDQPHSFLTRKGRGFTDSLPGELKTAQPGLFTATWSTSAAVSGEANVSHWRSPPAPSPLLPSSAWSIILLHRSMFWGWPPTPLPSRCFLLPWRPSLN